MEALGPAQAGTTQRVRAGAASRGSLSGAVPRSAASRLPIWIGAGVLAAVAVGFGMYTWLGVSKPQPSTTAGAPAAGPLAATASAAAAGTSPAAVVAAPVAVLPAVATTTAPAVEAAANLPFDPARDFERVVAGQSPDFHVDAAVAKPRLKIGKDNLAFSVKSEKDGYLYVLLHGTDDVILQVYPNQLNKNNRIRAGQSVAVPPPQSEGRDSWNLPAGGPAGTDTLIAIVSANPRDFSATGMKISDRFLQTTRALATDAARRDASGKPLFLGKPTCTAPCADDYGARVFTAEEVN